MPAITDSRYLVTAGWDNAPHLDESAKKKMIETMPPHMREARSLGVPSLGAGAIYPISVEVWEEEPLERIPAWWPRAYALDVGWNCTAAVWAAWDMDERTVHIYSEYKRNEAEPAIHAAAIRARGEWIPGIIDCAARGRDQRGGETLLQMYRDLGLKLWPCTKGAGSVEAGLFHVLEMISEQRIKHYKILTRFRDEYRAYHRDEKGRVVKDDDHLMDAFRYLMVDGPKIARVQRMERPMMTGPSRADRIAGY